MAQTIKLKRSSVSGRVPTTSDLELGEVAINTYDGKMYIKKSVGGTETVVSVGGGALATSFTLYEYTATSGQTTFSGSDGNSNTLAYDTGTPPKILVYLNGVLLDHSTDYTATNGTSVVLTNGAATNDLLQVAAYKSTVTSDQNLDLDDNQKILLGDDDDLQIYHDGSHSYIDDAGTGGLYLRSDNFRVLKGDGSERMIQADDDGAVLLYYDGSAKIQTTSTGVDVTGSVTSDSLVISGTNANLTLGTSGNNIDFGRDADNYISAQTGSTSNIVIDPQNRFVVRTNDTERMRIDSSGNVLIGKTSSSFSTGGVELAQGGTAGKVWMTRDGANVLYLNRLTSDGDIATFYKDGTTVGTIASKDGDLFIGTDDTRLRFVDASDKIYPANASGNARDNAIDLGNTNARFKDLYLAGQVNTGTISSGNITTTGYLRGPSTFTIDPATHGDDTGTVVIAGNLQVDGTTTTINSTTLTVDDKNITLASGSSNAAAANGAGITVDCGSVTDATLTYNGTLDTWEFNKELRLTTGLFAAQVNTGRYLKYRSAYSATAVADFEIKSDNNSAAVARITGTGTADLFQIFDNTSQIFTVKDGGNVGIGTNSPQQRLAVVEGTNYDPPGLGNSGGHFGIFKEDSNASGDYGIMWGVQGSGSVWQQVQRRDGTATAYNLLLQPSGGRVGIGTTNPGRQLTVEGTSDAYIKTDATSHTSWTIGSDTYGFLIYDDDVGGTDGYRIVVRQNSGNVGVGTTQPQAKFQVEEAGIDTTTTSTTATTQVAIDTFAAATFRSARYTIQVTNSTDSTYHLTEILLIHDGTTPQITEYGTIFTGSAEATFDADISSGNVRLLATPATTDSMTFKVVRHCITV